MIKEILKRLFGAVLGGTYGYLAAAAIGGALFGGAIGWVQQQRVNAAQAEKLVAEQNAANAQHDLTKCRAATERQNKAIIEIEERARRAQAALDGANVARMAAEERASQILRERTPANQDKCTAARNAFAEELRRERAK